MPSAAPIPRRTAPSPTRSMAREHPRSPRCRPRLLPPVARQGGEPCRSRPTKRPSPHHEWHVPERYNIAQDVCDKHPADKLAMIHEHFDGTVREVHWGELQELSNRFANVLRGARRAARATASRCCCRRRPRPPPRSSARGSAGAILLSMSVLYGDDGIRHRVSDSQAKVLVTNAANQDRVDPGLVEHVLVLDDESAGERRRRVRARGHARRGPGAALLHVGTTGLAKGIVHAHRYLLAHEEFIYCHDVQDGERFHGMGEWAWAAGIAPLLGPWRFGAVQLVYQREGGFDPHKQLDFLSRHRGHERLHDADRDALDDVDRRRGHALPAEVPHRLLRRRAAEPGGDPLVPRAVRADRARLLRADRVLSAVRQLPVHGGARGLDGQADARAGTCRSSTRTSSRCRRASAARSACARARTRTIRSATGATRRRRGRRSAATGSTPRTPPGSTRTATSGTRAAPTT